MDTMPYYICTRWRDDCTAAHPDDLAGQADCQSVICGQRNASSQANVAGGSASASGSAAPSATASSSGSSESSETSATASSDSAASSETGNTAAAIGMNYGTGILMGGMLAVFGLAL